MAIVVITAPKERVRRRSIMCKKVSMGGMMGWKHMIVATVG